MPFTRTVGEAYFSPKSENAARARVKTLDRLELAR